MSLAFAQWFNLSSVPNEGSTLKYRLLGYEITMNEPRKLPAKEVVHSVFIICLMSMIYCLLVLLFPISVDLNGSICTLNN